MSDGGDVFATDAGGQRERPFLFPWNRKLRHLQGISLRNLNVTPQAHRVRGKTIADDDVSYNLKSLAKNLAKDESKTLTHSRSYSDLTSPLMESPRTPKNTSIKYETGSLSKGRPGLGMLRRRSTLHWTGASPRARQQKLEDVAASRMADTWFSIHCSCVKEPIYISEVMEKSMNPSFRFFDLNNCGPNVTRSDELKLKVWAKPERLQEFTLLIELDLSLESLQFIGRTLENFHHPLPQNCVLFHLSDGIYTSFTDMPVGDHGSGYPTRRPKAGSVQPTSSYDALMQLANLDDCIQDALKTRQTLENEINSLLEKTAKVRKLKNEQIHNHETLGTTKLAVAEETKQLRQLAKKRNDMRKSIKLRREAISSGEQVQVTSRDLGQTLNVQTRQFELDISRNLELSTGQIRRICEDLLQIYPIEPIKNRTLQFCIRSIHLPNSNFSDTNRDEIAAALAMASHLVFLLSLYLSTPLPYPIELTAGNASITDPISAALAQRQFPLYPTSIAYKFEYAVFLLNKDIEVLMNKVGLRMLDIRHTLPNLKYLLYVLTAGTGELPARKAGGIRGLIPGGRFTPSISRRASQESVTSSSGGSIGLQPQTQPLLGSNTAKAGGSRNGSISVGIPAAAAAAARPLASGLDDPFLASPRPMGLPYRKSLLREAG